ncbi:MAG: DUF3570 domain-containing protein [Methylococcaceae bacterium]|nr:DUF3570 domain-containing protein [Methylococcaceae bacterium]
MATVHNGQPVTKNILRASSNPGVLALTAAALVLPGLIMPGSAQAADDEEVGFQYSHYQEGKRNLYGLVPDNRNPIEVDSIHGGAKIALADRIKFAFNYTEDTWGGATPVSTAPLSMNSNNNQTTQGGASPYVLGIGQVVVDKNTLTPLKFVSLDENTGIETYSPDTQVVHTMSVASPETRRQGDFKLSYEWDEAAIDVGGGLSVEPDYESRFGSLGGRFDFNQKRTTLNVGVSYTNSDTQAILDHDAAPYINASRYQDNGQAEVIDQFVHLNGKRQDWAANLDLTQVLTKDSLIQASVGYSRGTGYMANPYKSVTALFVNPNQNLNPDCPDCFGDGRDFVTGIEGVRSVDIFTAQVGSYSEVRPEIRNQWTVGTRFVQYINALDSALHFDYHFAADDWGIHAHTIAADWVQPVGNGWTITPRVRYYSQDAADFYTPYLVVNQARTDSLTAYQLLPAYYSSDQRLSGYGALSGGVSISKQFTKGVTLETGFEYYTHSGSLMIGGSGEGDYSNFDYYFANASLKVSLGALGQGGGSGDEHSHHGHHHGAPIPAGVMFAHMMDKPGDFMVGYRYMYSTQAGDMLHGSNDVSDPAIVTQGCGADIANACYVTPNNMNMHMHMLDIMYAPTDWLNLMLMPQFMNMNMHMRHLAGTPDDAEAGGPSTEDKSRHIEHHLGVGHNTGGVGDTGMYALFKLWGEPNHHVNLTLGVTAPTGDVGIMLRDNHKVPGGIIHYGMQLGSGTWDFKPALTYTGKMDQWSWGAQVSGTKRLEHKNSSGYALGDIFQSTAWGSYQLLDWLSASVRGVYTSQGPVRHEFEGLIQTLGPMDYSKNYGGKFWDLGLGLNAAVIGGDLAGNSLNFEWLQPVSTDYNGYQLDREGALSATWSYAF